MPAAAYVIKTGLVTVRLALPFQIPFLLHMILLLRRHILQFQNATTCTIMLESISVYYGYSKYKSVLDAYTDKLIFKVKACV